MAAVVVEVAEFSADVNEDDSSGAAVLVGLGATRVVVEATMLDWGGSESDDPTGSSSTNS